MCRPSEWLAYRVEGTSVLWHKKYIQLEVSSKGSMDLVTNERSHKGGMSLEWGHSLWGWGMHSKQRDLNEGSE